MRAFSGIVLAIVLPGCATMAGSAAEDALASSLSAMANPENRRRMGEILESPELRRGMANLTAGAFDGALVALSSEERAASVAQALGPLVRQLAREATTGADLALARAQQRPEQDTGVGGILGTLEGLAAGSVWLLPLLGLLLVAALVALGVLLARRGRQRRELEQRQAALLVLEAAVQEAQKRSWAPELREILRGRAADGPGGEYLRGLLRDAPH